MSGGQMSRTGVSERSGGLLLFGAVFAYVLLVAYGSLFPFSEWQRPAGSPLGFLRAGFPETYSQADLLVNLIAYVPLGLLLLLWFARGMPRWLAVPLAVLCGTLVSLGMETAQAYLSFRVSSLGDLLVNAVGTALGVGIGWLFSLRAGPAAFVHRMRVERLRPGAQIEASFWVGCLAMFVLVGTLAPSLDGASGRAFSVLPVWAAFFDSTNISWAGVTVYALQALGLLLLCSLCLRGDRPVMPVMLTLVVVLMLVKFGVAVMFLKVPSHLWVVSGKALLGLCAALVLTGWLIRRRGLAAWVGLVAMIVSYLIAQLSMGSTIDGLIPGTASQRPMNWIPFGGGHMLGTTGIFDVLSGATRFLAIGSLANMMAGPSARRWIVWGGGGVVVLVMAFATEWAQQSIPGRHADATDVMLALVGWLSAWLWRPVSRMRETAEPARAVPEQGGLFRRRSMAAVLGGVAVIGVTAGVLSGVLSRPVELPLHSASLPQHPDAFELPPVHLPGFRFFHPRLPAPSPGDIAAIRAHNPAYLQELARQARKGEGGLEAAITMAYVEPGSQNLDLIFSRLMAVRFHYRGNGTEIVVRGYDWLHHLWSDEQREQLRERLFEGFDFTYRVIREQRLSPYNVYWYNSPFQRLLALGVVLYGGDERGDAAMRVVHHLLKTEMLPVWRQVMGAGGGWHEGGEYIGIGIGQAVYRVPAIWRAATGEDLFASEPYLRGFLDFLVYRLRPDDTHFRWGDGRFFDRAVPDQYALAAEYGHAAALLAEPRRMRLHTPTSWPWGPLIDRAFLDTAAEARERLPLSRLFDGIGMMVARSDWGPEATYVTFKAGDNFWSHVHLDQGAFTIYKGGALAIDSGLYGPSYGSDHHMNYTYQTIAHNTITVFDPDDEVPVTNRHGVPRSFANDGGQRRVGSGWGVESAPMNVEEWLARREIYHTGKIVAYYEGEGLTVAVADITPAYTNAWSGKGTFSHRTRRVEQAWRVFAYDRIDDVVVVQDQVIATRSGFRKRWLLHTIEEPVIGERRFSVHVPPAQGNGRAGGRLEGIVVYPEDGQLVSIGGPRLEFFVDGVNYDESGQISGSGERKGGPEPGRWRIELLPGRERKEDQFLVVMLPSLLGSNPMHEVTPLSAAGRKGTQIVGPKRTTRWWFTPGRNVVDIELATPTGTTRISVGSP